MTDLLEPLQPIAEIVGVNGVKASYSDDMMYVRGGADIPGWRVQINAQYRGTHIELTEKARTLDEAAGKALERLKAAVGMK